jgi:hypothetical protein
MNELARSSRNWPGRLVGLTLGALLLFSPTMVYGQEATRLVEGKITYVEATAVEVDGVRGLIGPKSSVVSGSREVGIVGVRRGMPARLELDAAGRVLELRVSGVVE